MATTETQSLHRAVAILDCFQENQPELGVREIARQLDLHPSTVGRILTTLTSLEILTQDPDTRRYHMGSKVLKWSSLYMSNVDLRAVARPYMQELNRSTEETISLDIPDGQTRLCIERIESPLKLRWVKQLGERMPFFASASGRALLAFMDQDERDAILENTPFEQLTPHTTTDPNIFRKELALTRKRGFAVSVSERVEGVSCIAAPIFDATEKIIGAVTISGPGTRFSQQTISEYAKLLIKTTDKISQVMGRQPSEMKEHSYMATGVPVQT